MSNSDVCDDVDQVSPPTPFFFNDLINLGWKAGGGGGGGEIFCLLLIIPPSQILSTLVGECRLPLN